jgi:ACS family sodium-dependent inorganic phosphate cotransporter-like MFS transporter 5
MQATVGWGVGFLFDYIIRHRLLEINTIRKLSNSIGFLGPAFCLYLVTIARCEATLSVVLFVIALGFNGHVYSGYNVTHVDMAPDFAGTLMGITNCFANFAGILAPYTVGVLTRDEVSLENWAQIFYISSLIYCVSALIFVAFGSAKLQSWGVARQSPNQRGVDQVLA